MICALFVSLRAESTKMLTGLGFQAFRKGYKPPALIFSCRTALMGRRRLCESYPRVSSAKKVAD